MSRTLSAEEQQREKTRNQHMAKWLSQTTQARGSASVSTVFVSGAVWQAACSESPRPHVDATTSPSLRDRCVMLCSRAATLVLERRVTEAAAGTLIYSLNILWMINATERGLESLSPKEAKSGFQKKRAAHEADMAEYTRLVLHSTNRHPQDR